MPTHAQSLRRPYIYPHRSARMLPRVSIRVAAALAAAAALTFAIWRYLDSVLTVHNAVTFTLLELARIRDVQVIDSAIAGRTIPVLVTVPPSIAPWLPYVVVGIISAVLVVVALRAPLARGLATFLLSILGLSALAYRLQAPGLREYETFPVVWLHTELFVWLVLPSITALLFMSIQPSWIRGAVWMLGIEAFAVFWSAARLVVVLGTAQLFGPTPLPALWFVWGPLADVLYVTAFFSLAVHANLRFTPERRR